MVTKIDILDLANRSQLEINYMLVMKLNELIDAHEFWVDSCTKDEAEKVQEIETIVSDMIRKAVSGSGSV